MELPGDKEFKNDSASELTPTEIAALAKGLSTAPPSERPGPGGDGAAPKEEPAIDLTEEEVAEGLTILADLMYARTGADHWIITTDEKAMLGRRGKRVLDLIVKINPAWIVIGTFATGLGVVYGPRFMKDAQIKKEAKAEKEAKKSEQKKEDTKA